MALAGELAKYVGKELANTGSKALAKAGATSALSSLVPSAVTKVGTDLANKSVLSSLVPATARKLASGLELGTDAIPLFRGQMNRLDKLDYNNPNGVSPTSNGFFMTPNRGATDSWAGKGVVSVDADPNDIMTLGELEGLKKDAERYFSDPKYQMQIYNTNPRQAEIYDAIEASDNYQSLSQLTNKPFIERDGGQGKELGELVFFPDTRPELTAKYNDILASGKNQWATPAVDNTPSPTSLPVGTQIKFNKDLSIKSIDKPSKGRGWFADNVKNPHISKMVKENGLDKYLGSPMAGKSGNMKQITVQQDNYMPLYHQTSANSLADFSLDKRKAIGADYGMPEGIFLKDTNEDIGLPGKNQLRLDAKMNNPATFENREALAKYMGERNPKYTALVEELDRINDTYDDYLMDYMAERGMNPEDYLDFDTAMDSVDKYIEDRAKEARDMISTQLKKDGYDGAIINSDTGSKGRSVKSYVVMGKDQLRDNSVPVKFIKKSSGKPDMQLAKIETDVGLSPEQAEFFKDSKLRDANGQLIPVYHSTPANFTVFDNSKLGENTMYSNTAMGHFVTADKDFSSRFKDINGKGLDGTTMELYANVTKPITHPYFAGWKYSGDELDKIVEDYLIATDNQEFLDTLREYAADNNSSIYDEYMDMTFAGEDPFEFSGDERKLLEDKGYDAVEIIEGPKSGLVDGSKDDSIISSYAVFDGKNLKNVNNLKPTTNPDIRYSKDTGRSLTEMHERLKAMNKSRELDPNVKRIGNSAVAEVDAKTLPAGYEKVKKYLETSPNDVLYNALGVNLDDVDVSEWGDIIKNWIEEQGYEADKNVANNLHKVREIVAEQLAEELSLDGSPYAQFVQTRNALAKDNPGKGVGVKDHTISANNDQIYQTDAGKLDREYSERLGIGRSHTPMSDNAVAGDAQGVYFAGGIGVKPEFAQGETGVSTIAHERLHSWQNARRGQWDDRVIDAIDDLRGELKDFYHTKDQIKKYRKSGESLDYYANEHEQEARMLQSYLDNEGYTNTWKKNVADGTEWGDEVKPAFDKFYKKLRSLSKAGVALPAVAVLFGLSTNTGKKLDKKS